MDSKFSTLDINWNIIIGFNDKSEGRKFSPMALGAFLVSE